MPPRSDSPRRETGTVHIPVLLREVLQSLDLSPGLTVVDGTVGAAGHSREILRQISPAGRLIGLDRDPKMLEIAARSLTSPQTHLQHASYAQLPQILDALGIDAVDRLLVDLGLSSDQLADRTRGFSFQFDSPLDLRFDVNHGEPAAALLRRVDARELSRILREYGEEPASDRLAEFLVHRRDQNPIKTSRQLAEAVAESALTRNAGEGQRHPATRVFQALRIAVNRELEQLETLLSALPDLVRPGGIVAVISFHSLEDRPVKQAFRKTELWHTLHPKPILASTAEQRVNPRSRTAKLRAARRI